MDYTTYKMGEKSIFLMKYPVFRKTMDIAFNYYIMLQYQNTKMRSAFYKNWISLRIFILWNIIMIESFL